MTPSAPVSPLRFALIIAALAMIGPFAIDSYMPSFPDIEASLGATRAQMQQTLSLYLAGFSVMTLFHGALSDCFGRRSVILVNLVIFISASLGCVLAQSFNHLLFFRLLQGLSGGAGFVVGRAMIRDSFSGPEAQRMMATVTMMFGTAPAFAPIIGGWLQAAYGWRSVFLFVLLFALALCVLSFRYLPETLPVAQRYRFALKPLLQRYLHLMSSFRFGLLSSAIAFNFSGFFIYIAAAPTFIYDLLGLDETQFGWLFFPAVAGIVLGAFISGRAAGKITPAATIQIGYSVMFTAVALNVGYHLMFPPALPWTVLPIMLYAVGMSLTLPNLTLFALDLFPRQRGMAASLQTAQQSLFAAALAGFVAPYAARSGLGLALTSVLFLTCGTVCAFTYLWLARSLPPDNS